MKKSEREIIYNKYGGRCAYCGVKLEPRWHADHILPIVRDLKDSSKCEYPERNILENYNPSCPSCNIIKSSSSIDQFRSVISKMLESLQNYSVQYKFASKFNLVKKTENDVVFYYEKHSF